MKLIIITPQGEVFNEDVDYIIVHGENTGEFAIKKDHIPIVSTISQGYLTLVKESLTLYHVIIGGVLEQQNNIITIIAQEAHIGITEKSAFEHLLEGREIAKKEHIQRKVDYTKAERELKENIKRIGAGKL
jgi:F-type H+-transporting ATPase subunit epsilon